VRKKFRRALITTPLAAFLATKLNQPWAGGARTAQAVKTGPIIFAVLICIGVYAVYA
jgi:hypothetical protein